MLTVPQHIWFYPDKTNTSKKAMWTNGLIGRKAYGAYLFIADPPKTHSGKIMRRLLRTRLHWPIRRRYSN